MTIKLWFVFEVWKLGRFPCAFDDSHFYFLLFCNRFHFLVHRCFICAKKIDILIGVYFMEKSRRVLWWRPCPQIVQVYPAVIIFLALPTTITGSPFYQTTSLTRRVISKTTERYKVGLTVYMMSESILFFRLFFSIIPFYKQPNQKIKGLKLQYGKNTKIKDRGLTCKTQRKYMTNHAIATIFILVHNFIIYFLLPKSERED